MRRQTGEEFGFGFKWHPLAARDAFDAANWTIRETTGSKARLDRLRRDARDDEESRGLQVTLLRELFGNPYRPAETKPVFLADHLREMAQSCYVGGTFEQLPVVADALEEAGWRDAELLAHLRDGGAHVRGCWGLDVVLGKE